MIWIALLLGIWNLWQLGWLNRQISLQPSSGDSQPSSTGISIIIAAHNEFPNLSKHLHSWLEQDYPEWECIIVLDRPTDGSQDFLATQQARFPGLKIVVIEQVPDGWSPKKWAIDQGVKAARYDHFVLTDADCQVGPKWIRQFAEAYTADYELVLGLSPYSSSPGLLNLFVRYETWFTALQFAGAAAGGRPYMGLGRNLSYTRSFYIRSGGMEAIREQLSGDDDLLVNAHAVASRTRVLLGSESWTKSVPPDNWRSWWDQKTRHVSASKHYSPSSKFWLGSLHLSQVGFWLAAILAVFLLNWPLWGLGIILVRAVCLPLVLSHALKLLPGSIPPLALPALDFLVFIYNLSVVPYGLTHKPTWRRSPLKSQKTPRKTGRL